MKTRKSIARPQSLEVRHRVAPILGEIPPQTPRLSTASCLYPHGKTAPQTREICRTWHIDYLVANLYDPAWQDSGSWVWTLNPVFANTDFRALDCR